jgi:mRNA-degrading endonuclease toxin of MazEF toxin-antitoxin module
LTDIKCNAAHYYDPTAYQAIMSIEKEIKKERENKMINKELHKGDIIVVETNGKRIYGVIVTNNNLNYNQDQVGMVNISTQTDGVGLAYVDIFTNQPAKAICNKVWNVWKSDIVEFVRECSTAEMHSIDKALRYTFGLDEPKKGIMAETADILQRAAPIAQAEYVNKLESKIADLTQMLEARKADIETLRSQLDKSQEDADHWLDQAAKAEPNIAALTAERDTYKAMYEKLLDKLIGA